MREPKILIWDIETSHTVAAIFSLYQDGIPATNVLEEWYIICAAWKWLGESKTSAVSVLDDSRRFLVDPNDDYHVVKTLYDVLSEADAIVHHYGDNFDIKKLNTRLAYHGFGPLPPIIQIDTYKICKSKFKFLSNKLDYVGRYFKLGGKVATSPGLWLQCLQGNRKAIKEMVAYNKQDVDLLEKVYLKLAPYAPAKLNMNHFYGDEDDPVCPKCGGAHLQSRGYRYTVLSKYRRFQCQECGSWSSRIISKVNEKEGSIR